jgi:transcriptional regulator with XRE-family HTH domain
MTDLPYKNWISMSDHALTEQIGAFVRHHKLEQNKPQEMLAQDAGISRSTLSLLERGETVTLATLIQVLRVLDQLHIMNAFVVPKNRSPMALAKLEQKTKRRARGKRLDNTQESNW